MIYLQTLPKYLLGGLRKEMSFIVCRTEVFNTYIDIKLCISQKQQNFIMCVIVLGQHVSILIESSSGPSKIQILT